MKYHDGSAISLGDIVRIAVPGGTERARVVMLGDSREHLDIDKQFLAWVEHDDKLLEPNYVVLEFLDRNPFAHNDPQYASVENYMFSPGDSGLTRDV
jgi:hypothetical protein